MGWVRDLLQLQGCWLLAEKMRLLVEFRGGRLSLAQVSIHVSGARRFVNPLVAASVRLFSIANVWRLVVIGRH